MNSKELEEVLHDFNKQFLFYPDGEPIEHAYLLPDDSKRVYKKCSDLIFALEKYNRSQKGPAVIERCVFCGQIIPQKRGGDLK